MNSDKLALDYWMALDDAERTAFARQCRPEPQLGLSLTGHADAAGVSAPHAPVCVTRALFGS